MNSVKPFWTAPGSPAVTLSEQKTVTEVIPYYYRFYKRTKILRKGVKPGFIPEGKVLWDREWKRNI